VLAYDYPLLGFFWSTMFFFIWIVWLMLLFRIIADVFRSDDLGGLGKTLWLVFVIFLPYLGTFVYLISRGNSMTERGIKDAQDRQAMFDSRVREAAGAASPADEIAKLAELQANGTITAEEFAASKAKVLQS
jgi:hypothetical protein